MGNARLASRGCRRGGRKAQAQPGKDIEVGGAGLAGACMQLGLIDEWQLFVAPVLLGGGTPYFPPLDDAINLELVETRTFGDRVAYLRYRTVP